MVSTIRSTLYLLTGRHIDAVDPKTDTPDGDSRDHEVNIGGARPSVPKQTDGE